jgi:hypothetical protein
MLQPKLESSARPVWSTLNWKISFPVAGVKLSKVLTSMMIDILPRYALNAAFIVLQAPAALNECLVTFAHLPSTYRHHFRDVAVLGGISDGLCMLLDLCWHLTASNA